MCNIAKAATSPDSWSELVDKDERTTSSRAGHWPEAVSYSRKGRGGQLQAVAASVTRSQNLGLTSSSTHILSLTPIHHGKKQ